MSESSAAPHVESFQDAMRPKKGIIQELDIPRFRSEIERAFKGLDDAVSGAEERLSGKITLRRDGVTHECSADDIRAAYEPGQLARVELLAKQGRAFLNSMGFSKQARPQAKRFVNILPPPTAVISSAAGSPAALVQPHSLQVGDEPPLLGAKLEGVKKRK